MVLARSFDHILTEPIDVSGLRAVVVSAPEQVDTHQRAYVDTELEGHTVRLRARWIAEAEPIAYGAVLRLTGSAQPPRQDSSFDERGFLLAHAAAGTFQVNRLERSSEVAGVAVLRSIHTIRSWLLDRLYRALPPPERQIVSGILLGQRSGLDDRIETAVRATGTTHLLVASGSNVAIIAVILLSVLGVWLSRRWTAGIVMAVLLAFVVITGADASIIRATTFFGLVLLAHLTGRRAHPPTLIAAVALLMVMANPWILFHDVGFQLSFAAIYGLFAIAPWLEAKLPTWLLPHILASTLAAQLCTLPLVLYTFGQASLIAPLSNVIAQLYVETLMAGGAISIALPWFGPLTLATKGVASAFIDSMEWFASLPYAAVQIDPRNWSLTLISLALIGLVLWLQRRFPINKDALGSTFEVNSRSTSKVKESAL